jgi:GT2 family glycosyltransferase
VEPGWLRGLLAAVGDGVGGVCSRLMFRDEPGVVNSTGLVPYRDGRAGDRHVRRGVDQEVLARAEVFGGCGASLLLRRELLDDVGGFDPALFMYYEDLDLAWRSRLRGWRFVYAPESVVHHVCGGSSSSPLVLRQVERNRVLVALSNAPAFLAASAVAGLALRFGRLAYRFAIARARHGVTAAHLRAMAAAFGSVICHAPARLLARYETRIARRLRPDRVVNRFVSPAPQRG